MTDDGSPNARSASGGTPPGTLMNLARGAKGIALLFFLLPWVTFSCNGAPLATMTGVDMAVGRITLPASLPFPGAGAASDILERISESARPDLLILLAGLLIVAGLVVSFLLARRPAAAVAMATSLAACVLIAFDVFVRLKEVVEAQTRQGRSVPQQMEQMFQISVDPQVGFWLTLIALIAAAVLFKMVHGRRDTA